MSPMGPPDTPLSPKSPHVPLGPSCHPHVHRGSPCPLGTPSGPPLSLFLLGTHTHTQRTPHPCPPSHASEGRGGGHVHVETVAAHLHPRGTPGPPPATSGTPRTPRATCHLSHPHSRVWGSLFLRPVFFKATPGRGGVPVFNPDFVAAHASRGGGGGDGRGGMRGGCRCWCCRQPCRALAPKKPP